MSATDWCLPVHSVWTKAVDSLRDEAGSRHESTRDAVRALVALGAEGHRGSKAALADLSRAFTAAVGEERVRNGEWHRLLVGAIQLAAAANPTPLQHCEHDPATALPDVDAQSFFALAERQRLEAQEAAVAVFRDRADVMIKGVDALPFAERAAAVRALIPEIATWGGVEQGYARDALTGKSGLSGLGVTEFRHLVKAQEKAVKEVEQAAAAEIAKQQHAERVAAAVETGALLPPPHAPIDVARALAGRMTIPSRWWRGDYYLWDGTRYREWAPEAVDHWLYGQTADAKYEQTADDGAKKLVPWRPSEARIGAVGHALSRGVLYRPSEVEPDDSPSQVVCANGVYDVPTGTLLAHDPNRFNMQSVPFDFDATAQAPTWEWFLNDVLPADAQAFLQEWLGYLISGRTDLEKIANLVGRRRSGKGTIATVIEALLGAENVSAPSMPSLVGTFGEAPFIGKTLAVFSDISWGFRDIAEAVEIVKKISGNDSRDVNRKNREVWHGKLGVRFMIMGNDMPKFTDASGALAGRLINIQFPGSFYGREKPSVKTDLLNELPGILNWALQGLARLTANGRFTVPQTSEELTAEIRRQQSPVQGFLDDLCAFPDGPTVPVPLDELHPVYTAWARQAGIEHPMARDRFSAGLISAGLNIRRERLNGVRARYVYGVVPQLDESGASQWVRTLHPYGAIPPS